MLILIVTVMGNSKCGTANSSSGFIEMTLRTSANLIVCFYSVVIVIGVGEKSEEEEVVMQ